MHIVMVFVQVKPEYVQAFVEASMENVLGSNQEPGIARFDFMQQADDPTRFCLYEVYHSKDAPAAHRETAHYKQWRDAVQQMMAGDRIRTEFVNLYPTDDMPADAW